MLNLVFGAGGASGASVPVTNLRIELRASRQLISFQNKRSPQIHLAFPCDQNQL